MKRWTKIAILVAAVAVLVAWYAFRPERLVVNRRINEAMPAEQGGSPTQVLESGRFYSILHPTAGIATIYQMGERRVFCGLRISTHQTVPMFTSTWLRPTMRKTWLQWKTPVSLIWE